jgi:hypothetical protein
MGRAFYSFEAYDAALDAEIAAALNDESSRIQVNVRSTIIQNAEENVYNTYPNPKIEWSRRYNHNGILDPNSYTSRSSFRARRYDKDYNYSVSGASSKAKGFMTYIRGTAEWQQRFGGDASLNPNTLIYAIEKNGLYGAPPRPYMDEAETEYGEKYFEKDLVLELEENGF